MKISITERKVVVSEIFEILRIDEDNLLDYIKEMCKNCLLSFPGEWGEERMFALISEAAPIVLRAFRDKSETWQPEELRNFLSKLSYTGPLNDDLAVTLRFAVWIIDEFVYCHGNKWQ